jgi:hypothetical protein
MDIIRTVYCRDNTAYSCSVISELSLFQRLWCSPGLLLRGYRGLLSLGSIGRNVNLITHLSLVPRLASGGISPLSHILSSSARREQHCVCLENTPKYFPARGVFNICFGVNEAVLSNCNRNLLPAQSGQSPGFLLLFKWQDVCLADRCYLLNIQVRNCVASILFNYLESHKI